MQDQKAWFDQTAQYSPVRQQRSKKPLIIAIIIAVGIVGAIIAAIALLPSISQAGCVGANEYAELTDDPYDASQVNAKENFYSYSIQFVPGTTTFDDSEEPKNTVILNYMGDFYKKHSDKNFTYTLIAPRSDPDNWYLGQDRLDRMTQVLLQSGIPGSAIVTKPLVAEVVDESDYDSDTDGPIRENEDIDGDTIMLRITTTTKQCES